MGNVDIEWNPQALYELRSSPEVVADLTRRTAAVFNAVGGASAGYSMSSMQGARKPQGRWRETVAATGTKAKRDNAKNNTLLLATGAARG
ncbi:hypothetical protein [Rhodococcus globerulus]|uniref:hypothetical protein n=1 Tax=Rhodococcus globerulus TaxID=33008 RepID=UPI001C560CF1|nr:hypothetical protein [Rhodococcus globerulus]QXW04009.1 hypothetical protein KYT97_08315 [Rhodococcus globerulus]